jgi:hypothetical protein
MGTAIAVGNPVRFRTAIALPDLTAVSIRRLTAVQKRPQDPEQRSLFRNKLHLAFLGMAHDNPTRFLAQVALFFPILLSKQLRPLDSKPAPKQGTSNSKYAIGAPRAHSNWQCLQKSFSINKKISCIAE